MNSNDSATFNFNAASYSFIDASVVRNKVIKLIVNDLKEKINEKIENKSNYLIYYIPSGYEKEIVEILEFNHFKVKLDGLAGGYDINW